MKKILLIDDDTMLVNMITERLGSEGYEVLSASDGNSGFKEAQKKKPDLILLDVKMGKTNGFDVLNKLKEDKKTRGIPVFMLTGNTGQEDINKGIQGYADKYITKPFETKDLLNEIRQTLSRF